MGQLPAQLDQFWALVKSVWNTGFMGYSIGNALVALLILLAFYVFRGVFGRFVLRIINRWTKKTATVLDDQLTESLASPLQLIFVALGVFIAFQYLDLKGEIENLGTHFVRSLISFAIFWALFNVIAPLSVFLKKLESILTREMITWLVTGLKWGVIFLGAATILQIWGIQVGPIVAGLGLFGVAVALGAQDLFRNLIGGLCILIEKRFKVGDWVQAAGVVDGTVEHIGFRSTKVRRFDQAPVFVPNQKLSDAAVINFSQMTYRRIYWKIGLEYRATLEQLKTIRAQIEDYLRTSGPFVQPPEASMFVRIDAFNTSSVDLMLYTFTRTIVWGEWLEHKENLAYRVKEIVEGAGCSFAFPSQSVYIETHIEGAPEPFVPPADK